MWARLLTTNLINHILVNCFFTYLAYMVGMSTTYKEVVKNNGTCNLGSILHGIFYLSTNNLLIHIPYSI